MPSAKSKLLFPSQAALLIIDVQKAIDHPMWAKDGPRNNKSAEANMAKLLKRWRKAGWPVYHIKHNSTNPKSAYRPRQPFNDFKPEAMPLPGETIITKFTNSAFIGTDLEDRLRNASHATLVIAGVITNNSVEATVRMAGNLGFAVFLAEDACFTFARRDWNGKLRRAADVHAMTLANLDGEYCKVVTTAKVLRAVF
jgi:nicotinamidase-related amidase